MEVEKYTVINSNEIVLEGVPEKEEICEGNVGTEVDTKSYEEEYGLLNANEVVLSEVPKNEETYPIKPKKHL